MEEGDDILVDTGNAERVADNSLTVTRMDKLLSDLALINQQPDNLDKLNAIRLINEQIDRSARLLMQAATRGSQCDILNQQTQFMLTGNEISNEQLSALTQQNQLLLDTVKNNEIALNNVDRERLDALARLEEAELERTRAQDILLNEGPDAVKELTLELQKKELEVAEAIRRLQEEAQQRTQLQIQSNEQVTALKKAADEEVDRLRKANLQLSTQQTQAQEQHNRQLALANRQASDANAAAQEAARLKEQERKRSQLLIEEERQRLQEQEKRLLAIESTRQQLALTNENTTRALTDVQNQQRKLQAENERLAREAALYKGRAEELTERLNALPQPSETLAIQSKEYQEQLQEATERLTNLTIANANLQRERVAAEEARQKAEAEKTLLDNNNLLLLEERQNLQNELTKEQTDAAETATALTALGFVVEDNKSTLKRKTEEQERIAAINQQLTIEAKKLRSDYNLALEEQARLQNELSSAESRLLSQATQLEAAMIENPDQMAVDQRLLSATNELTIAKSSIAKLNNELQRCKLEARLNIEKETSNNEETLSIAVTETEQLRQELSNLEEALASVRLFRFNSGTNTFFATNTLLDPLSTPEHRRVLILNDQDLQTLTRILMLYDKLRTLVLYAQGRSQNFLTVDPRWEGDYRLLRTRDFEELRRDYGVRNPEGVPRADVVDVIKGLGAPVTTLTHLEAVNQVVWQARVNGLRNQPAEYTIEFWFSRGKPTLAITRELRFVVSNVHLIEDPTNSSGELYYAIDLARPHNLSELQYIELGSLVMNAIYGHGSFVYRVREKETEEVIKEKRVEDYAFPEDKEREYNTKVILQPSEDVIFYARDMKNDTYMLETILIKA